jgi:hypothetical protein
MFQSPPNGCFRIKRSAENYLGEIQPKYFLLRSGCSALAITLGASSFSLAAKHSNSLRSATLWSIFPQLTTGHLNEAHWQPVRYWLKLPSSVKTKLGLLVVAAIVALAYAQFKQSTTTSLNAEQEDISTNIPALVQLLATGDVVYAKPSMKTRVQGRIAGHDPDSLLFISDPKGVAAARLIELGTNASTALDPLIKLSSSSESTTRRRSLEVIPFIAPPSEKMIEALARGIEHLTLALRLLQEIRCMNFPNRAWT